MNRDEPVAMFKTRRRGAEYNLAHGLDWDRIRKEYLQECSPEEYAAMQTRNGKAPVKVTEKSESSGTNNGAQYAKTPVEVEDRIVELYDKGDGAQPGAIATECGVHPATVRRILRSRDVYDPSKVRYATSQST